jgi:Ca2+/Na+ antiporter
MFKAVTREITSLIQARSGLSTSVVVSAIVILVALAVAFAFLCVSAYAWLAVQFGTVFAGLIMAGIFVVIAIFAAIVCAAARRRVRERAILARAARAHSPSWLLDPKVLGAAVEAGRSIGWQRIVPVALLAFLAAQWAREYRDKSERQQF